MSYRRWAAMAVVLGLLFSGPPAAVADAPYVWDFEKPGANPQTVTGKKVGFDDFTSLRITVSKTAGLGNEGVLVTWEDLGRSTPQGGFSTNYLQLMQCWGPDPTAADFRETCQFGAGRALGPASLAPGAATPYRDLITSPVDPLEVLYGPDGKPKKDAQGNTTPSDWRAVPFRSALTKDASPNGSPKDPFPKRADSTLEQETPEMLFRFFDQYNSNEVPYARTAGDHKGRMIFETQTAVQAPHMGCGLRKDATGNIAPCWLVVVPRGDHDADGRVQGEADSVDGSPLSRTFFNDAIPIRLDFAPVSSGCPEAAAERGTMGSELVVDAMVSWQPKLCAVTPDHTVYGFSQNGDADARAKITVRGRGAPGMAFSIDPMVPGEGDPTLLQAPVTASGIVIAFTIDTQRDRAGPDEGAPIRELKLNQRLVAKLLTRSYQRDVPGGRAADNKDAEHVSTNLWHLRNDPEFVALNPDFATFLTNAAPDGLMVSLPDSSAAREVWRWIRADKDANDFLNGVPYDYQRPNDPAPRQMRVNKYFLPEFAGGRVPPNYPNPDKTKFVNTPNIGEEGFDMGKYRPYMKSMHEAALQTLRADAKGRTEWDQNKNPPAYKPNPPQAPGRRFSISITDSVSAQRYGLYPASLRNAKGEYVAPTPEAMLAGVGAMTPSTLNADVLVPDPQRQVPGAYPLTMLTYATADTSEEPAARKEYAALLRYAVGDGQIPGRERGQLPPGYVPLPQNLRQQTLGMADKLEKWVNPPEPGEEVEVVTPDPGVPPVVVPAPSLAPKAPVPAARATRSVPVGLLRWAWVAILAAGLVGALSGPTLLRWENRRRRRT
ncbi:hypothetical protein R8Z50_25700 [Longispora sp. K20-0274]|uniref:hypothetical protein n=1 Tax=Longispora sp. K20-0274 TaxID=3088255 RepID=UPI003999E9C5